MFKSKSKRAAETPRPRPGDRLLLVAEMTSGQFTMSADVSGRSTAQEAGDMYAVFVAARDGIRAAGFPSDVVIESPTTTTAP